MMVFLVAALSGALFAVGLGVSQMTDANRVLAFLNLAGDWDPALAWVMVGALAITIPASYVYFKRERPWFAEPCEIQRGRPLDARLLLGAALFGMGWGLGGFCPGPALLSGLTLAPGALVFLFAMLVGMVLYDRGIRRGEARCR